MQNLLGLPSTEDGVLPKAPAVWVAGEVSTGSQTLRFPLHLLVLTLKQAKGLVPVYASRP